jgi:hypothetical protein
LAGTALETAFPGRKSRKVIAGAAPHATAKDCQAIFPAVQSCLGLHCQAQAATTERVFSMSNLTCMLKGALDGVALLFEVPLPRRSQRSGRLGRWLLASAIGTAFITAAARAAPPAAFVATPAPAASAAEMPGGAVQRIDDYAAATAAARQAQAMLLVSVEPTGSDPADTAGQHLERPDVQQRFADSGTPWVFCRVGMEDAGAGLVANPGLVEMRRGPGLFVVDYAHGELTGRIVSILPRKPGKYYRFSPSHIDELAALPAGTLTQRSLILAVRLHPENPQSTQGTCDPELCREAAAHSGHQARIRKQGHHDWQTRSQRIAGGRGGASEVCAESWENQDLLDSCVDCVASWRQSSGHWNAVRSPQSAYGYDIRRGGNGIWYATGIFLK